jgi:hypothetical protein
MELQAFLMRERPHIQGSFHSRQVPEAQETSSATRRKNWFSVHTLVATISLVLEKVAPIALGEKVHTECKTTLPSYRSQLPSHPKLEVLNWLWCARDQKLPDGCL